MSHGAALLEKLGRYQGIDPPDSERAHEMELFVRKHPDAFERSLLVGHLTGSAWLVDPTGERVLLTHHKKLNRWLQLGGHADGNPDLLAVALKEAREESGLANIEPVADDIFDLDIHRVPVRAEEPEHFHYDVRFALRALGSTDVTVSAESHALEWVPIDAIERRAPQPEMLRMRDKWRRWVMGAASRKGKS